MCIAAHQYRAGDIREWKMQFSKLILKCVWGLYESSCVIFLVIVLENLTVRKENYVFTVWLLWGSPRGTQNVEAHVSYNKYDNSFLCCYFL
jgi:hypothetical protein